MAVLALPRWKAFDRLPNLCTQFIMDLLLRLRKGLKALETFQELSPERYRYTEYATIPRGVLSLLKSSFGIFLKRDRTPLRLKFTAPKAMQLGLKREHFTAKHEDHSALL